MGQDLNDLRFRNAQLRGAIEQWLSRADISVRDANLRIASEQSPAVIDDSAESLELVHDNLRRRADALIRAGVAKSDDFKDLL